MTGQEIYDAISQAIVILGGVKIRADQLAEAGMPITQAIQILGKLQQGLLAPQQQPEQSAEGGAADENPHD